MLEISEYERLRQRPEGPLLMHQSWRELLFLHFAVEPETVQPLIPSGLSIDTYPNQTGNEMAWVGLVLFRMQDIRSASSPAVPWLSAFPETNVRTYVHRNGHEPGVWFFSLDAARWLACAFARMAFALPYYHSYMSVQRRGDTIAYKSTRKGPGRVEADVEAKILDSLASSDPRSLEFFLVERYLLYAQNKKGLFTGRVWHKPYPLRSAELISCSESLCGSAGIQPSPWEHVCFCEGVDVEVFGLNKTAS